MKKAKALQAEIKEILQKPMPWGPMVIQRAQIAMQQTIEVTNILISTVDELQDRIKFYENIRTDAKMQRNIEILKRYEAGETQAKLSHEFNLTKQRIQRICMMTRKHIEGTRNGTQTQGLPRESNSISAE